MALRPYQDEFVCRTMGAFLEFDKVLGVSPTGSGKTIMAGELCKLLPGRILFLADAKELVYQAADKIAKWTDEFIGVEMAKSKIDPMDDHRIIVATTQSIATRLEKYEGHYFSYIIIDEAHRNTLGSLAKRVLDFFESAQVLGITATPFRSDKKQLGSFYETISYEIGLVDLIKQGFLSRITVKSVPANISLDGVRSLRGDYIEADLGKAIEPHLMQCAELLKEHAGDRKTVTFLPLVATSKAFCAACNSIGLNAVHVDGKEREDLKLFQDDKARVICNASLLTTGWDQPDVDCVYILRPTKSFVLYSQMVGRGTRIHPGKTDLLLLDPMFMAEQNNLIRPARLIAQSDEEVLAVQKKLDMGGGDVLHVADEVKQEEEDARSEKMKERLEKMSKRKGKTIDYLEFCLTLNQGEIFDYEPTMKWESAPPSLGQIEFLKSSGFDPEQFPSRGLASKMIDMLIQRRNRKLATPKQMKWLKQFKVSNPESITFEEASAILDKKFAKKRKSA